MKIMLMADGGDWSAMAPKSAEITVEELPAAEAQELVRLAKAVKEQPDAPAPPMAVGAETFTIAMEDEDGRTKVSQNVLAMSREFAAMLSLLRARGRNA